MHAVLVTVCIGLLPFTIVQGDVASIKMTPNFRPNCSNHCSQEDKDLTCWDRTAKDYAEELIRVLRDYLAVLVDIDQWRWRHVEGYTGVLNITQYTEELTSTLSQNSVKYTDSTGFTLSPDTINSMATVISTQVNASSTARLLQPPEFTCPVPCTYHTELMTSLLAASVALNVLLIIGLILYVVSQERRTRAQLKLRRKENFK